MTNLSRRVMINVALLLLAAGVLALVWLDPWRAPPPVSEKLSEIDPTRVVELKIRGPERSPIVLTREDSVWRVASLMSLPANENRVTALLGLASATVHDAFRAEGNDLGQFGLKPPKVVVLMNDDEFRFGDTEPLNGWRYIHFGPDVHLISDLYYHHLLATPASFVDPAPIGAGARPVGLVLPGAKLRLLNGRWRDDVAERPSGDDAGERLANAWTSARAASVKGFDAQLPWTQTIQVLLNGENKPLEFRLAMLEHELVLGRPKWQVQYHFPRKAGLRLLEIDGS